MLPPFGQDPRLSQHLGPVGYPPGYDPPPAQGVVGRGYYPAAYSPQAQVVGRLPYHLAQQCPGSPNGLDPLAVQRAIQAGFPLSPMAQQGAAAGAAGLVAAARQISSDNTKDFFGVDSGAAALIAVGATVTVTTSPQKNLIPEKLSLSDNVANNFLILRITCGVNEILATTGGIPGSVFRADSTSPNFRGYAMPVGMDFSIQVQNIGGAAARFLTAVIGTPFRGLRSGWID